MEIKGSKKYKYFQLDKKSIKNYFYLNTKKITFLATFISMYFILGVISYYIPFFWPAPPVAHFLKFEFTDFLFLLIANFYNFFYIFISILICSFCRIPDTVFPVSNISLIIIDLILVFYLKIFNLLFLKFNKNIPLKNILSLVGVVIFSSITMCLVNEIFFIKFYVIFFPSFNSVVSELTSPAIIWGVFFPFSLVNFSLNATVYFLCLPLLSYLKNYVNL